MLDAAKDDATLLPFDTVFIANGSGKELIRTRWYDDDSRSVCFAHKKNFSAADTSSWDYYDSSELSPFVKSKPKKWQNGTQAQLDAAKDDARLIPKKTYFMAIRGDARGLKVFKIDNPYNDYESVAMMNADNGQWDFYWTEVLEPIND